MIQALPVSISEFSFPDDIAEVLHLWQNAGEGIQLRESDRPEEIQKKILRDPDLFLVARTGGRVIGAVMGGFDGRRGFIYHLAVAKEHRGQGVARRLMSEVEDRLRIKGCIKVNLLVTRENQSAMAFYEEIGYQPMPVLAYGKVIS